ncbi:toprim domain-containing protein [Flammeovirga agarivorans]|uniref:Toprim domain-containing protein n=1 Tax=Flammeovirga agarivorans TaxID=2726742 RepID=A0A7X8SRH5_9BACT|nr:toprim domain-containing protein [Flammeovirga agarivorans]NLR94929.1 toprim domain-containing protein [Flammeovirga agarivorans]
MSRLQEILEENDLNPKLAGNEIRCKCIHRENHSSEGGKGDGSSSLFINPAKGVYNCFSCGEAGTLTRFLDHLGVEPYEAFEIVTDLKEEEDVAKVIQEKEPLLHDCRRLSKEYLSRGYRRTTLRKFLIAEASTGVTAIPYFENNKVVAIKTRWINAKGDREFHVEGILERKKFLYNLDKVSNAKKIALVEGESDVWRLDQYGIPAVATLGTSVTLDQALLLLDFEEVVLFFDNDIAGESAAKKLYKALDSHINISFAIYSSNDPGDCSEEEALECYNNPSDYFEYSLTLEDTDLTDAQDFANKFNEVKDIPFF